MLILGAADYAGPNRRRRLLVNGGMALAGAAAVAGLWWHRRSVAAADDVAGEVCFAAPALPYDARSGLARHAPRPVPADARCPVTGGFPAQSPQWAAQAIYLDGSVHFFDSALSLHRFRQDVGRFARGRLYADLAALWVTDAETGQWVRASEAFHVRDSGVPGPTGHANLPAFASAAAAERFAQRHGGQVLPAAGIDADTLHGLGLGGPRRRRLAAPAGTETAAASAARGP